MLVQTSKAVGTFCSELFYLLEHSYFGPILLFLSSWVEYPTTCSWYRHWVKCHMLLPTIVGLMRKKKTCGTRGKYVINVRGLGICAVVKSNFWSCWRSQFNSITHLDWLPATNYSSSRLLDIPFWMLWSPAFTCKHTLN